MPRLAFPVALLAVLPLGACRHAGAPHETADEAPVAVKTAVVHQEMLDTLYRASGTVRGRTTAVLTSKTTGYVRSVEVRPGDHVKTGQLLALLEANDVAASVRRAHAGFDQSTESRAEAENGLKAAQVAARIAKSTYDRVASLFADHSVPQQEYDEVEARWRAAVAQEDMAQARLRAAISRIAQAKAEVGEAQATLDYARIAAPFAGRIIERRVDPGNLASPGMPLLVVEEDGKLRIETSVEESRAASVAMGDTAFVEIESLPQPLRGTVGEIVPTVDVASRSFLVKVDLPDEAPSLRPGMFARVGFRVGARPQLVVPTTAITPSGALDRVFAADGDHLRLRMITLGEVQGPWTCVLSGLTVGEKVALAPTPALHDGARFAETQ